MHSSNVKDWFSQYALGAALCLCTCTAAASSCGGVAVLPQSQRVEQNLFLLYCNIVTVQEICIVTLPGIKL